MGIYISHLYVELDINVGVASFYVIFSEKLVIGESVDFSFGFCIYIGRKWFGLWVKVKKTVVVYCLTSYYLFGFTTV